MSAKFSRWFASLAVCGATSAIFLPLPILDSSAAAESERLVSEIRKGHRPAQFYYRFLNIAPELCYPLLEELNKEYWAPHSKRTWQLGLLGNSYLVNSWMPRTYAYQEASGQIAVGHLEVSIVDLNNDGQMDAIYRELLDSDDRTMEHLAVSSPAALEDLLLEPLSYDRYLKIIGDAPKEHSSPLGSNVIWVNPKTTTPSNAMYFIEGNDDYFFDLIQFEGRVYVLAASVVTAPQEQRIFVLELKNPRELTMRCQFRGPGTQ